MDMQDSTERKITKKQRDLILLMAEERDIDQEKLKTVIRRITDKTELDQLYMSEASHVIDELSRFDKSDSSSRHDSAVGTRQPKPISEKQKGFARALATEKGLSRDELSGLVQKTAKKSGLEQLTSDEASRVIDALKQEMPRA